MSALLALELRRALARRATRALALLVLAGIVTAGIAVFFTHSSTAIERPPPEQRQEFQECLAGRFIPPGETIFVPGRGEITVPAAGTSEMEEFCRIAIEAFVVDEGDDRYYYVSVQGALLGTATPLAMIALVLGATLIGAEWRANTIATQLTWEPRRVRVLGAKVAVAALVGAGFFVLAQAALAGALLPAGLLRGTTEGVDRAWVREALGLVLRGGAFAAIASTIGFTIATVGRNTTAALGVMFGYIALAEGTLLGNIWPWMRRWLLLGNSIVFVSGSPSSDVEGRTVIGAGLLLAAYAAGAWLLSAVWFARRDVT